MNGNEKKRMLKVIASKLAKRSVWVRGIAATLALTASIGIGSVIYNNSKTDEVPVNDDEIVLDIEEDEHNHDFEFDFEDDKGEELDTDPEVTPDLESEPTDDPEIDEDLEDNEDLIEDQGFDYGSVVVLDYDGVSIVDALAQNGYDTSFEFRSELAEFYGIEDYTGTAEQNIELLNILIQKGLEQGNDVIPDVTPNPDEIPEVTPNPDENPEETPEVTPNPDETPEETPEVTPNPDETPEETPEVTPTPTPDPEPTPHKHSWSLWEKFTSLFEKRDCECGEEQTRRHTFGAWFNINSLLQGRECKTCDYEETREIEKDEEETHTHSFGNWYMLNASKEERECACGVSQTRDHSLGAWVNNGNGTQTRECGTCDYEQTITISNPHSHNYGNWTNYSSTQEIGTCSCGEKNYRNHTLGQEATSISKNSDGTHSIVTKQLCTTCDYEISNSVNESCKYGEYVYNPETKQEQRTCSVCGYVDIKGHIHSEEPSDLAFSVVSNNDGTHKMTASYICTSCDEVITITKDLENCSYVNFNGYNSTTGKDDYSCDCGHVQGQEHSHSEEPSDLVFNVGTSNNDGTHTMNASYTCTSCGEVITITKDSENCSYGEWVNNGNQHEATCECGYSISESHTASNNISYEYKEGVIVEVDSCTKCDATLEETHSHSYGEYQYKDENTEEAVCVCGYEPAIKGHTYGSETAKEDGTVVVVCESCKHEKEISTSIPEPDCEHLDLEATTAKDYPKNDENICWQYTAACKTLDCDYTTVVEGSHNSDYLIDGATIYYECLDCGYSWETSNPNYVAPTESQDEYQVSEPTINEEQYNEIVEEVLEEMEQEQSVPVEEPVEEEPVIEDETVEQGKGEEYNQEDSKSLTLIP